MRGIVSYGAYVPFNRLQRAVIGAALEERPGKGERAVASYDEDSATMAVEAARNCLAGASLENVSSLTFATTSPPYQEKLNAATVHAALELPAACRALDVCGSVRAGLGSLAAGADGAAGRGQCLVTMSDIRLGAPGGAAEGFGGDGAVAFLLGDDHLVAEIVASYSSTLGNSQSQNARQSFSKPLYVSYCSPPMRNACVVKRAPQYFSKILRISSRSRKQ